MSRSMFIPDTATSGLPSLDRIAAHAEAHPVIDTDGRRYGGKWLVYDPTQPYEPPYREFMNFSVVDGEALLMAMAIRHPMADTAWGQRCFYLQVQADGLPLGLDRESALSAATVGPPPLDVVEKHVNEHGVYEGSLWLVCDPKDRSVPNDPNVFQLAVRDGLLCQKGAYESKREWRPLEETRWVKPGVMQRWLFLPLTAMALPVGHEPQCVERAEPSL